MVKKLYSIACLLLFAWLFALPARAQESNDVEMDNGTCSDGTMLIPEVMAMHCGLSCKDATDKEKINECLNTLAKEAQESSESRDNAIRQLSSEYLVLALQSKALAGNYEEEQDELLDDGSGGLDGSPASGGMDTGEDGSDLRVKQEKTTKLAAQSVKNMVQILNVYSSKLNLDFIDGFYRYDAPYRKFEDGQE